MAVEKIESFQSTEVEEYSKRLDGIVAFGRSKGG